MELKTVYFEHAGKENTDETLRIAKQRAEELGIKTILVASTFGDTGVRAVEVLKGMRVIVVTHPPVPGKTMTRNLLWRTGK